MTMKQHDDKPKKRRRAKWRASVRMPEARRTSRRAPHLPSDDVRYRLDLLVMERGVPHYVYLDSAMRVTTIKAEDFP